MPSFDFLSKYFAAVITVFCLQSTTFASEAAQNTPKETVVKLFTQSEMSNMHSLSYPNSPRISQVITDAVNWARKQHKAPYRHMSDSIYWQAAALLHTDSQEIEMQRISLVEQLEKHKQRADIKSALTSLIDFIHQSHFKARVAIPVEYDYHATGGAINPKLTGAYQLYLPEKPAHVWVVGAVTNSQSHAFAPLGDANHYLQQATLLSKFGHSDVWVISPNGIKTQHKIAYWNKESQLILAGSVIFVPFKALPDQLNQAIANYLSHRVMSS